MCYLKGIFIKKFYFISDLAERDLTGQITQIISRYSNLQILCLYKNKLSGEIPDVISLLSNLQDLYLFDNNLSGPIPHSISSLTNLKQLNLNKNNLSYYIPPSISNLTNLHILDISNNKLSGTIPDSLCNLSQLQYLNLYCNKLSGEIPESISNLSNLQSLYLNNNKLSGEIPESLSLLTHLQFLGLSNNNFNDEIPNSIVSLQDIIKKKKIHKWRILTNEINWEEHDISIICDIENLIEHNQIPNDINELASKKEYWILHENTLSTWDNILSHLMDKNTNINNLREIKQQKLNKLYEELQDISNKRLKLEEEIEKHKKREFQIITETEVLRKDMVYLESPITTIQKLVEKIEYKKKKNDKMNNKVRNVLNTSNNLSNPINEDEIRILLDKMNLVQYYNTCIEQNWYENIMNITENDCKIIDMNERDKCCFLYNIEMMKYGIILNDIKENNECIICEHNTPIKTIELLEEWNIQIDKEIILNNNWITPYLLYITDYNEIGIIKYQDNKNKKEEDKISKILNEWKTIHYKHLLHINLSTE